MKNKNIAFLIILSINGICSLQSMYEVGGRGSGSEVLTEGFVSSWHTSAEIAEGNLEPRTTHTQSSPSEAAHEDEQARLLRIRQETAARDNSFEVIGDDYKMNHQSDDLLSVSSGRNSSAINDSGLSMTSHVASPVRQDLNISQRERKALLDKELPQKNFAKDRAWIEREANKALDEGAAELKAAEQIARILKEKKFVQKEALNKSLSEN